MDVEIFSLSEYATLGEGEGKLTLAGIFDTLYSDTEPITYPIFYIAARIKFVPSEVKIYQVEVNITDSKNEAISNSIKGTVEVKQATNGKPSSLNLIIKYESLVLPKQDDYKVNLYLDDRMIKSTFLYAILS